MTFVQLELSAFYSSQLSSIALFEHLPCTNIRWDHLDGGQRLFDLGQRHEVGVHVSRLQSAFEFIRSSLLRSRFQYQISCHHFNSNV